MWISPLWICHCMAQFARPRVADLRIDGDIISGHRLWGTLESCSALCVSPTYPMRATPCMCACDNGNELSSARPPGSHKSRIILPGHYEPRGSGTTTAKAQTFYYAITSTRRPPEPMSIEQDASPTIQHLTQKRRAQICVRDSTSYLGQKQGGSDWGGYDCFK